MLYKALAKGHIGGRVSHEPACHLGNISYMEADSNLDDSKDSERLLISTGAGYSDGQG